MHACFCLLTVNKDLHLPNIRTRPVATPALLEQKLGDNVPSFGQTNFGGQPKCPMLMLKSTTQPLSQLMIAQLTIFLF